MATLPRARCPNSPRHILICALAPSRAPRDALCEPVRACHRVTACTSVSPRGPNLCSSIHPAPRDYPEPSHTGTETIPLADRVGDSVLADATTQRHRSSQPRRAHQTNECARVLGLDLSRSFSSRRAKMVAQRCAARLNKKKRLIRSLVPYMHQHTAWRVSRDSAVAPLPQGTPAVDLPRPCPSPSPFGALRWRRRTGTCSPCTPR